MNNSKEYGNWRGILTDGAAWDVGFTALDQASCDADPVVELGNGQLQLLQPLRGGHIKDFLELLLLGELAKRFDQFVGVLFGDKTQEVGQVQHAIRVADLVHTVRDVRRDVDKANELHLLATGLDDLGYFIGNDTTVRVTRKGVWSVGLDLLHSIGVTTDHLGHRGEDGLTLIETTGAEGVEGALSVEVLGQVDEDQNFSDTWVDEEDGSLVPSGLEGDDRVVNVSV